MAPLGCWLGGAPPHAARACSQRGACSRGAWPPLRCCCAHAGEQRPRWEPPTLTAAHTAYGAPPPALRRQPTMAHMTLNEAAVAAWRRLRRGNCRRAMSASGASCRQRLLAHVGAWSERHAPASGDTPHKTRYSHSYGCLTIAPTSSPPPPSPRPPPSPPSPAPPPSPPPPLPSRALHAYDAPRGLGLGLGSASGLASKSGLGSRLGLGRLRQLVASATAGLRRRLPRRV